MTFPLSNSDFRRAIDERIARYSFVDIHLKLTICKRSEFKILRRTRVINLLKNNGIDITQTGW